VTVSYNMGTVLAADGGVLQSFTDQAVTNNMPVPPPTFVSAATNVTGTTIIITFSKTMADPAGKQTEFNYKIGVGPAQSFSAAALDADNTRIDLTCSGTAIAYGDIVTVSYNMGTVLAADGGVLQSFTDQAVTNNMPVPPPTFVSAATDVTGTTIIITFSKTMADPAGKQAEFSYKIGVGPAQSFSAAALDADNIKIDLTCSGTAIAYGDTVTVSYNMGTVLAADGNVLQSFTDQAVTNNVPGPPTFVSAATNTAGTTITITFSKTMADPTGKQGEFSYKVNGGPAQSFSAAALDADNTRIDLTCSGTAIVYGDIVTVSYNMGTVLAADGNVLQSFTDQAVTNNVQQSSQQVTTATGTGTATFTTSNGAITGLTAAISTPCGILSGFIFPHGFFSFNITNIPAGSTVIITITLPSNMPMGTWYWKCINGQWVDCTSLLGDNNGDNILTLTITDGGLGDADGVANGTIVDPGGPAVVQAAGLEPAARRVLQTLPNWLKPAQMSLQYLNINPQQAYPNQPVTIITNVVNTGDEAGNYNVVLKINGQVEQTKTVSVGRRGTQPVKFTVTESQPGTYAIDIGGQTGSFTIIGAGGSAGAPLNGVLIAVLIIGVLILAAVVVLILKFRRAAKKRKAAQEDTLQIRK
ncbi:MAG: choice-of-anchor U domain-containing protein, partial [Dehalococcoidia bacterium]